MKECPNCDAIYELFNKPAEVLKPLYELYRKEHPDPDGRNFMNGLLKK